MPSALSSAQAIFAGAALIAASVVFAVSIRPAVADPSGGPFRLEHHSNNTANAGVFRIDTATGEVSYCYVSGQSQLVCSAAVK